MQTNAQTVFLSIIIPVFNERERIATSVKSIADYLSHQEYTWEIIVVDDGSSDDTTTIIKKIANEFKIPLQIIENGVNKGKGYSVRQGVRESKGEFVIFTDADLCCPVEEITKFINLLKQGKDIVIGSRTGKGAVLSIRQPWWREIMGKIFNLFVQLLVLPGIWDTQCGFKGFKGNIAKDIFKDAIINRFGFDVEILFIAKRKGYNILETGVIWRHSFPSRVHPLCDSFHMLLELLIIKFRFLKVKQGREHSYKF